MTRQEFEYNFTWFMWPTVNFTVENLLINHNLVTKKEFVPSKGPQVWCEMANMIIFRVSEGKKIAFHSIKVNKSVFRLKFGVDYESDGILPELRWDLCQKSKKSPTNRFSRILTMISYGNKTIELIIVTIWIWKLLFTINGSTIQVQKWILIVTSSNYLGLYIYWFPLGLQGFRPAFISSLFSNV